MPRPPPARAVALVALTPGQGADHLLPLEVLAGCGEAVVWLVWLTGWELFFKVVPICD